MNDSDTTNTEFSAEQSPFKFLDYYTEQDDENFAGREDDVREVLSGILRRRVFVVYGRSGIGKTSLLMAGVFPALKQRGYSPVYVRVLESPTGDLTRTLLEAYSKDANDPDPDIHGLLRQATAEGRPVVIVLDQFEEFFIRFRKNRSVREEFIYTLATLLRDESLDVRIVFSLREDYLAEMDDFRDSLPNVTDNRFRLSPLSAFGTRQAIAQPLVNSDIPYDQMLLSRLVDMLANMDFDTPLLQIICTEVYREALRRDSEDLRLTTEDLAKVGGLEGIFRRYLDAALKSIAAKDHLLVRLVLNRLITVEHTKEAVNIKGFLHGDFIAEPGEIERILKLLVKHRLVREEHRSDEIWYELLHERLVDIILKWLQLDPDYFNYRVARDLIANSSRGERWRDLPEALLTLGQIDDVIGPYRTRLRLDDHELEFVLRSAIFRHSSDVSYWAGRFGGGESASMLLLMFDSEADDVRLGAAVGIGQLQQPDAELLQACYQHAITDSSEAVRRQSGKSYARHANEGDLDLVEEGLKSASTRAAALEVVADLRIAGHGLERFSWRVRRHGRRITERRLYQENSETIQSRAKIGALHGLLGGLAWIGSIAAVYVLLFTWQIRFAENDSVVIIAIFVIFLLVASLGMGTLFGWHSSLRAARDAALSGQARWFRATLGSVSLWFFLVIVLSFWSAVIIEETGELRRFLRNLVAGDAARVFTWISASIVIGMLVATLVQLFVAGLVRLFRNSVVCARGAAETWFWCLSASTGLPFLVPGLMLSLSQDWLNGLSDKDPAVLSWLTMVALAPVISLSVFVACLAIGRGEQQYPLNDKVRGAYIRSGPTRAFSILAVMGVIAWYQSWYGFQHTPLNPTEYELANCASSSQTIEVDMERGIPPESRFLRIRAPVASVISGELRGGRALADTAGNWDSIQQVVLPAGQSVDIVISSRIRSAPSEFVIFPKCLTDLVDTDLERGYDRVHVVELKKENSTAGAQVKNRMESWSAEVTGTAPSNSLVIFALPQIPIRPGRSGQGSIKVEINNLNESNVNRDREDLPFYRWDRPLNFSRSAYYVQRVGDDRRWSAVFTLRNSIDDLGVKRLKGDRIPLVVGIMVRGR